MPYINAGVINVSGINKQRLKALAAKHGQSENAVLTNLLDQAESGLDIAKEIPSSCTDAAMSQPREAESWVI